MSIDLILNIFTAIATALTASSLYGSIKLVKERKKRKKELEEKRKMIEDDHAENRKKLHDQKIEILKLTEDIIEKSRNDMPEEDFIKLKKSLTEVLERVEKI